MKVNPLLLPGCRWTLATSLLLLLGVLNSPAATRTWTGGGLINSNWNDSLNWGGLSAPGTGDTLIFPSGASRLTNYNNYASGLNLELLTFTGAGYVVTGNSLNLTNGIRVGHATGTTIFRPAITLLTNQTFTVSNAAARLVLGPINLAGQELGFDGPGDFRLEGPVSALATVQWRKQGPGLLEIAGTNTDNATLTVSNGVAWVNGQTGTGAILVYTNGTLGGTGVVERFYSAGGVIRPGLTNPGVLTIRNMVQLDAGTVYAAVLNSPTPGSGYNQLRVTNDCQVFGAVRLAVAVGGPMFVGDSFTIIEVLKTNSFVSFFTGLTNLATFTTNGVTFQINYNGGTGNDVVLTVVGIEPTGVTHVWTGHGAKPAWSVAENWQGDVVPQQGDALLFPATANQFGMENDFPSGRTFQSLTFSGSNYTASGNAIYLSGSITNLAAGTNVVSLPITFLGAMPLMCSPTNGLLRLAASLTGAALVEKLGSGALQLSATNAFTNSVLARAGTLWLDHSGALGTAVAPLLIESNAVLALSDDVSLFKGNVTNSGALHNLSGSNHFRVSVRWNIPPTNRTYRVEAGSQFTLEGVVNGSGSFTKTGPGLMAFTGANNSGTTGISLVNEGELFLMKTPGASAVRDVVIGNATNAPNSAVVRLGAAGQLVNSVIWVNESGWFDLAGHNSTNLSLVLTGGHVTTSNGLLALSIVLNANASTNTATLAGRLRLLGAGQRTVTVQDGPADPDLEISADIESAGVGLLKQGAGRLVLSGTNTYTGSSSVFAGTLTLNSPSSFSAINVLAGTLTGTGVAPTISGSGGTLRPGDPLGTLTGTSISIPLGFSLSFWLYGTNALTDYNPLRVGPGGNIALGGQLFITAGYTPQPGESFMVVQNDGPSPVSDTFSALPQGGFLGVNGVPLQIDYTGGDGNDIVLTRVPAPPATLTLATVLTNGHVVIAGQGIGAVGYTVEAATNLTPVIQWTLVGQPLANSSGQFSATDTNAPLHPVRFYRAVSP